MKCPRCGAENVEGLKVCKGCWSSLSEPNDASATSHAERPKDRPTARGPLFGVPYEDQRRDDDDPAWDVLAHEGALMRPNHGAAAERLREELDAGPSPRSVLSLILGLLSVVLFCLLFFTVPIDLAAFVLGMVELREINRGAAPSAGRGFATAGVVLSGCALVVKLFIFIS
jgi:hypothetical protein